MRQGRYRRRVLATITIITLFSLAVSNLIVSLQDLSSRGPEYLLSPPQPVEEPRKIRPQPLESEQALAEPYERLILIALLILTLLVLNLWMRRYMKRRVKAGRRLRRDPLATTLAGIISVLILLGVFLLGKRLPHSPLSIGSQPTSIDLFIFLLPTALAAIIGASLIGLLLTFRTLGPPPSITPEDREMRGELAEKAASILDETLYSLEEERDLREVIIRCYGALCSLLEEKGAPNRPTLTAREFEDLILSIFDISPTYLHDATLLFEKARYSGEEISEEEAKLAQLCISRLREEISNFTPQKPSLEES